MRSDFVADGCNMSGDGDGGMRRQDGPNRRLFRRAASSYTLNVTSYCSSALKSTGPLPLGKLFENAPCVNSAECVKYRHQLNTFQTDEAKVKPSEALTESGT